MNLKSPLLTVLLLGLVGAGCSVDHDSELATSDAEIIEASKCDGLPAPTCGPGTKLVDSDGDGCDDACEPIACPAVVPVCEPGEKVADADGDGCALECVACPAILCQAGTKAVDSNGDGCEDECVPEPRSK